MTTRPTPEAILPRLGLLAALALAASAGCGGKAARGRHRRGDPREGPRRRQGRPAGPRTGPHRPSPPRTPPRGEPVNVTRRGGGGRPGQPVPIAARHRVRMGILPPLQSAASRAAGVRLTRLAQ